MSDVAGPTPEPEPWPEYCCAILRDQTGRFLLEERPATAAHAADRLTCFGGAREPGESPRACIARELREELGLTDLRLERQLRLVSGDREIAWFYRGEVEERTVLKTEPGRRAVWLPLYGLASAALSAWHRAALEAALRGEPVARV